eukprot:605349-Pelagomonas_calceolata.AAC.6
MARQCHASMARLRLAAVEDTSSLQCAYHSYGGACSCQSEQAFLRDPALHPPPHLTGNPSPPRLIGNHREPIHHPMPQAALRLTGTPSTTPYREPIHHPMPQAALLSCIAQQRWIARLCSRK